MTDPPAAPPLALPPAFPDQPLPDEVIFGTLEALRARDVPTTGGRTTSYVYDTGREELRHFGLRAFDLSGHVNGLDPTAFVSWTTVENDLVAAGLRMLGSGSPAEVGTLTSGGTESCMLPVLGARERWRERVGDPDGRPTLVAPTSVHPAFTKACHLFDVEMVRVPTDPVTFRADVAATAAAIDERTALVVGSTPSYAQGVIDPIEELAALAAERDIPCHMDACIGGWTVPFIREAEGLSPIGLMVPGVTSVSVDLHKYGYTPKGASLLLWSDNAYRRYTWFATADWNGYPVINTTLLSTKGGGVPAVAWAFLKKVGYEGYRELALAAWRATRDMAAGVVTIPGLRVVGDTGSTLLAFSDTGEPEGPDIRVVADEMVERGWLLGVQPGRGGPPTAHISVQAVHDGQVPAFLDDLRAATDAARGQGRVIIDPNLLALAQSLDVPRLTDAEMGAILAFAGIGAGGAAGVADGGAAGGPVGGPDLPDRRAMMNAIIDAAPAALVERLLIEVLGQLMRPTPQGGAPA
ncbi:MAG: pyridoxal-dependent decarboxylase [Candidatus Nanopelagicales bacterium]|nr:pyridoxal-dependent decarboxylase [Candidatus Nanopelagicales bacterium]